MADETPKIIVDDDWKSQAQAEKAKLSEAEAQKDAEKAASGAAAGGGQPGQPTASFEELVRMFALPALMYMGQMPDPQSGKAVVALDIARLHIDLLGMLEDKTKGNLADDEQKLLSGTVNELRLAFVEISKAVEQAVAEGKLKPQDVNSMGPAGGVGGGMGGGMGFGPAGGSPGQSAAPGVTPGAEPGQPMAEKVQDDPGTHLADDAQSGGATGA